MFRVRQDWLPHAQAEGHGFDSGGVTWKLKINDKGVTWKIQPKEVETFDAVIKGLHFLRLDLPRDPLVIDLELPCDSFPSVWQGSNRPLVT